MKGDFTRSTFNPKKHYSSVRMQQGRVQLDADWNEQVDIQSHLMLQTTQDVVGLCGAPLHNAGFALTVEDSKLMIGAGHYYVHGTFCENETKCEFTKQPDFPEAALPTDLGNYLFYLDVWQRHISAVEDEGIREVALNGPDTATRTKTVWQVRWVKVTETLNDNPCNQTFKAWNTLTAPRNALLAAQAQPQKPASDPCIVPPGAGYRGLENQLYRVEIHTHGGVGTATFKWSRDNGSIVRAIEKIEDNTITIHNPGQDVLHAFAPEQWVEVTDELSDLKEDPGTLARLTAVTDGINLAFDPATVTGKAINHSNFPKERLPKVRRWDQTESAEIKTSKDWLKLENGIEVCFQNGDNYQMGDYWLIPARAATGQIEWRTDSGGNPLALPRFGIEHHYCRLAVLQRDATGWKVVKDCRELFPPLTEMMTLSYVSGDGQEAMPPDAKLPAPLQVRVTIGEHLIEYVQVEFKVKKGRGKLGTNGTTYNDTPLLVKTQPEGIAQCYWQLDATNWSQQVEATLLDAVLLDDAGNPVLDNNNPVHPSVRFNANLSIAAQVSYTPPGQCPALKDQTTVQQAINRLAQLVSLYHVSGDGQEVMPGEALEPLVVLAADKCGPVKDQKVGVSFQVVSGKGNVNGVDSSVKVTTDENGIATCKWELDSSTPNQQVEATLLADNDHPTAPPTSVRFTANLNVASQVAYDPKACPNLKGVNTVQEAIDKLCQTGDKEPGIQITKVYTINPNVLLLNDTTVPVTNLKDGLVVVCADDANIEPATINRATTFVTLELPVFFKEGVPVLGGPAIGFQPLILAAMVTVVNKNEIHWIPATTAYNWLQQHLSAMVQNLEDKRILARLTLKGNFIWAANNPLLYLDGEALGAPKGKTDNNLYLPSGDGRRGGDFEMWFWLVSANLH